MSLHCDNLSGELQDQWSSSLLSIWKMSFYYQIMVVFDIVKHDEMSATWLMMV